MAEIGTRSDWATEEAYWRSNYKQRPYVEANRDYIHYAPAYRFGYEATERYQGRNWKDIESDLRRDWDRYPNRGQSTWEQMKDAIRDAWNRVTGNR